MSTVPDKIRNEYGLVIKEKLIPDGYRWNKNDAINGKVWAEKGDLYKAQRPIDGPESVTIHNPGDGMAELYVRATMPNQNMHSSRVHYYIDDIEAWQMLRENEVGWHAGDGSRAGGGNMTSLAIEICMGKNVANPYRALVNGALLAAILLHRHKLPLVDGVTLRTHKSWTGRDGGRQKQCPQAILPQWAAFVKLVEMALAGLEELEGKVTPVVKPPIGAPDISKYPSLSHGNKDNDKEYVIIAQRRLKALGYGLGDFGTMHDGIDGDYGDLTDKAVEDFKLKNGISPVDGGIGPKTWEKLLK